MPTEPMAGPCKLSISLASEATTEGCKAALAAAGDPQPLICGVSVEPSQAPVTLVILLGDDELQARVIASCSSARSLCRLILFFLPDLAAPHLHPGDQAPAVIVSSFWRESQR